MCKNRAILLIITCYVLIMIFLMMFGYKTLTCSCAQDHTVLFIFLITTFVILITIYIHIRRARRNIKHSHRPTHGGSDDSDVDGVDKSVEEPDVQNRGDERNQDVQSTAEDNTNTNLRRLRGTRDIRLPTIPEENEEDEPRNDNLRNIHKVVNAKSLLLTNTCYALFIIFLTMFGFKALTSSYVHDHTVLLIILVTILVILIAIYIYIRRARKTKHSDRPTPGGSDESDVDGVDKSVEETDVQTRGDERNQEVLNTAEDNTNTNLRRSLGTHGIINTAEDNTNTNLHRSLGTHGIRLPTVPEENEKNEPSNDNNAKPLLLSITCLLIFFLTMFGFKALTSSHVHNHTVLFIILVTILVFLITIYIYFSQARKNKQSHRLTHGDESNVDGVDKSVEETDVQNRGDERNQEVLNTAVDNTNTNLRCTCGTHGSKRLPTIPEENEDELRNYNLRKILRKLAKIKPSLLTITCYAVPLIFLILFWFKALTSQCVHEQTILFVIVVILLVVLITIYIHFHQARKNKHSHRPTHNESDVDRVDESNKETDVENREDERNKEAMNTAEDNTNRNLRCTCDTRGSRLPTIPEENEEDEPRNDNLRNILDKFVSAQEIKLFPQTGDRHEKMLEKFSKYLIETVPSLLTEDEEDMLNWLTKNINFELVIKYQAIIHGPTDGSE